MNKEQFKQSRLNLGLSQNQLAKDLGLAKNGGRHIRRIESGEDNASGLLIRAFELLIDHHGEAVSNCCGASVKREVDICTAYGDHCDKEYFID